MIQQSCYTMYIYLFHFTRREIQDFRNEIQDLWLLAIWSLHIAYHQILDQAPRKSKLSFIYITQYSSTVYIGIAMGGRAL